MDLHTIFNATPPVSYLPNLIPRNSGICQRSPLLAVKRFKYLLKVEKYLIFLKNPWDVKEDTYL